MKLWVILGTACISFFVTVAVLRYRNKKRIHEILKMIEELEQKKYKFPMKQDDFSILEDEVYKLFLKVVEERETTKKIAEDQIENLEDIAHQIKTPITSMGFSMEVMSGEHNTQELENLKNQVERLNRLTDVLLKLSNLEANITKMKKEKIYIKEVFDYAFDILEGEIQKQNITIVNNVNNEVIQGDFYWIAEAMINILRNAIGISNNQTIQIDVKTNPIYTKLIIEDEAGGIEPKNLKKIFQRFYKTPDSRGFGIGLSMAKTIIENNHGEIQVKNGEKGAIFSIKFYNVT